MLVVNNTVTAGQQANITLTIQEIIINDIKMPYFDDDDSTNSTNSFIIISDDDDDLNPFRGK